MSAPAGVAQLCRLALLTTALVGCAAPDHRAAPTWHPVVVAEWPSTCLPGSELEFSLQGVPADAAVRLSVALRGEIVSDGEALGQVDWLLPAERRGEAGDRLAIALESRRLSAIWPGDAPAGELRLQATLLVEEIAGWTAVSSPTVAASCALAHDLSPEVTHYAHGPIGVNGKFNLEGSGFLLAPTEGRTRVLLDGCFFPSGTPESPDCTGGQSIEGAELDALAATSDRTQLAFVWPTRLTGLGGGVFRGTLQLRNDLVAGMSRKSPRYSVEMALRNPRLRKLLQDGVSLGQFLDVEGDGFVGGEAGEVTLLRFSGQLLPSDGGEAEPVKLELVPQFVDGEHLRYVLDEADALGRRFDLRKTTGTLSGTLAVITRAGSTQLVGDELAVTLDLRPVKQVVYLRYLDSYRQSLKLFGLEDADQAIRARVLAVAQRDYAGVNVEFRTERPRDFLLFSEVDIAGPDPNGVGYFGFDNTPGKDVGNQRLYDRIGGLDATTQSDGTPGFGGVFTEQFLGFSRRPGPAVPLGSNEPLFDLVFDPVRPDSGRPVDGSELGFVDLSLGSHDCPASGRAAEVRCAILALGNLIGSTVTHELGHSLGLADPGGKNIHDLGDAPARLMDAGDARPLSERAELAGDPPARFCAAQLVYLQGILPPVDEAEGEAARRLDRPRCDP